MLVVKVGVASALIWRPKLSSDNPILSEKISEHWPFHVLRWYQEAQSSDLGSDLGLEGWRMRGLTFTNSSLDLILNF
jgi:hypothetical protein